MQNMFNMAHVSQEHPALGRSYSKFRANQPRFGRINSRDKLDLAAPEEQKKQWIASIRACGHHCRLTRPRKRLNGFSKDGVLAAAPEDAGRMLKQHESEVFTESGGRGGHGSLPALLSKRLSPPTGTSARRLLRARSFALRARTQGQTASHMPRGDRSLMGLPRRSLTPRVGMGDCYGSSSWHSLEHHGVRCLRPRWRSSAAKSPRLARWRQPTLC